MNSIKVSQEFIEGIDREEPPYLILDKKLEEKRKYKLVCDGKIYGVFTPSSPIVAASADDIERMRKDGQDLIVGVEEGEPPFFVYPAYQLEQTEKPSQVEKLDLEEFKATGTDDELKEPRKYWRELLAGLRYLGNSAFPRLQEGKEWNGWDRGIVLRYFGKIIDTLRDKLYFPFVPPEEGEESYNSSYWQAYRRAKEEGYIRTEPPSEAEIAEWDRKREKLLKDKFLSILKRLQQRRNSFEGVKYRETELERIYNQAPEKIVVTPDWMWITGSEAYARDREPNDTDIVFREPYPGSGATEKFRRLAVELTGREPEIIAESAGPIWGGAAIYDLVAVKKPRFEIDRIDERETEFAQRFYKTKLISDPGKLQPGRPVVHYGVKAEEYYKGGEEKMWKGFVEPLLKRGHAVIVQPKGDGFRLHVWKLDGDHKVYTEKGEERSKVLPGLNKALAELNCDECLLDTETLELRNGKPRNRWELAWLSDADKMPESVEEVRIAVHDIYYLDGEVVADKPYTERLKILDRVIPDAIKSGKYEIRKFPSKTIEPGDKFKDLKEVLEWARKSKQAKAVNSEGSMVKDAQFKIEDFSTSQEVKKYKVFPEIDCAIIGYRKVPAGRKAGEHWTESEAKKAWADQIKESDTYMFRCALLDKKTGALLPLRSQQKVSESDLKLRWDEDDQKWRGQNGPEIWHMFYGFDQLKPGDFHYNKTYALKLDKKPKEGDVVTVTPEALIPWTDKKGYTHLSWSHPIAKQVKRDAEPGTVDEALKAFGFDPDDYDFLVKKNLDDAEVTAAGGGELLVRKEGVSSVVDGIPEVFYVEEEL